MVFSDIQSLRKDNNKMWDYKFAILFCQLLHTYCNTTQRPSSSFSELGFETTIKNITSDWVHWPNMVNKTNQPSQIPVCAWVDLLQYQWWQLNPGLTADSQEDSSNRYDNISHPVNQQQDRSVFFSQLIWINCSNVPWSVRYWLLSTASSVRQPERDVRCG